MDPGLRRGDGLNYFYESALLVFDKKTPAFRQVFLYCSDGQAEALQEFAGRQGADDSASGPERPEASGRGG